MGFVAKGLVSIPFKKEEKKKKECYFISFSFPSFPPSLSCPSLFPPKVFIDSAEKEKKKVVKFRSVRSTTQSYLILRHSHSLTLLLS